MPDKYHGEKIDSLGIKPLSKGASMVSPFAGVAYGPGLLGKF